MKILFVSSLAPRLSGAVSRLLYDILMACPEGLSFDYSVVGLERIEIELPENINFIGWRKIQKNGYTFNSIFKKNVRCSWKQYGNYHIDASNYDIVITYPYQISALDFVGFSGALHTIAVDSATMVYLRGVLKHSSLLIKLLSFIRLMQTFYLDRIVSEKSTKLYLVGLSDSQAYNVLFNNQKTQYIPHSVTDDVNKYYRTHSWNGDRKLRIIFAGSLNYYYTGNLLKEYINSLSSNRLQDKVEVYLLGKKNNYFQKLVKAGYNVIYKEFVDSFEEYLSDMDIFVSPLLVGGGTKNRILTAVGLGLDVIASDIAIENVYGMSCDNVANSGKELIFQLNKRIELKKLFSLKGNEYDSFLKNHSVSQWTKLFWSQFGE